MFTGIIEEIGQIKGIKKGEKSLKLLIGANKILEDVKIGDSISTNGVCLTVTDISKSTFEVDVMNETIKRSNINDLSLGSRVNLERALKLGNRFDGHIVSGHIDGIGEIASLIKDGNSTLVSIKATLNILRYIVEKGSVAIDGTSLTVVYVDEFMFKVSIIPHTAKESTLLNKNLGQTVNIECDVIGKYVERLLKFDNLKINSKKDVINEEFLSNNGFL